MTSIAVIGAGPAGCYTAQALRKSLGDAEITVIDRLPVPYGLVRYGVAADHQGTKTVTRQFARVFERQDVTFLGNIDVGRDIELQDIQAAVDAVVLATGLYADRSLEAEGGDLDGVYGSGAITRYWNGHPDSDDEPSFGERVAVIGNGNVAMDIVRLLAKRTDDFEGSDIDLEYLNHAIREIHVIGRSDLGAAKFDIAMVKELAGISDLGCSIADGDTFADTPVSSAVVQVTEDSDPNGSRQIMFHSGWATTKVTTNQAGAKELHLVKTSGKGQKLLTCDSVITAIGFEYAGSLDRDGLLQGATSSDTGVIGDGLFATGWFRRGPNGTIPENRSDAIEVAAAVTDWLSRQAGGVRPGRAALLEKLAGKATTYEDWLAIDKHEIEAADVFRCRKKVRSLESMLDIIEAAKG